LEDAPVGVDAGFAEDDSFSVEVDDDVDGEEDEEPSDAGELFSPDLRA
jgi:hypothetical protein